MRITESRIRQIIREELLLQEQTQPLFVMAGDAVYDKYKEFTGEKSAQGLSTSQKIGYAAARGVLDATPAGAREVATGNVPIQLTTYWDLSPVHKQIVLDVLDNLSAATGALSVAFPPAAVIPVATGIVSATLKFSDGDIAGGITNLLGSILVGLLATGKLAEFLTKALGTRVAGLIGKNPRAFLRNVFGDGATLMPEIRGALAKLGGATDLQAAIAGGYRGSAAARGAGLALKAAMQQIFDRVDGVIAKLLVAASTKSGRAELVTSYNGLKGRVLAFLENPAGNPTLADALVKAERIVAAA